jgi:hypothetical protein
LYLEGSAEPPPADPDALRVFTFDPISGLLSTTSTSRNYHHRDMQGLQQQFESKTIWGNLLVENNAIQALVRDTNSCRATLLEGASGRGGRIRSMNSPWASIARQNLSPVVMAIDLRSLEYAARRNIV